MIVMKFGGTSVQDAAAMRNVTDIVLRARAHTPLVVLSACSGVTNGLINLAKKSAAGHVQEAMDSVAALRDRHCAIAEMLFQGAGAQQGESRSNSQALALVKNKVAHDCGDLEKLVQSLAVLKELTPRTLDQFAAYGEQWSSLLFSHELLQRGVGAHLIDARKILVTGDEFTRATPSIDRTTAKAREFILPLLQKGTI